MKTPTYRCHVICSTHWDREWVNTELENRFFLIGCFDELIDLFEREPDSIHFHLDAQSIPIEDYVEARPARRPILERYVREHRLLIGPWYSLPEMNVTDGECTIRNLLMGHKLGKSFGHVMKVGYTPTGWGQLSQLPQIYRGFGIDSAIFYRGINQELTPAEYIWQAPDGTDIVGIRPSTVYSRANLYSWVYLPVVQNKVYWEKNDHPYWPGNGQAYRLARHGEEAYWELSAQDRYDGSRIPELMQKLIDGYKSITTTGIIPAFQGHDQSRPHPEVPRLIREINEKCSDVEMIPSDFEQYASEVMAAVRGRAENVVVSGEMRHTNKSAMRGMGHLLPGILSCRAGLKMENRRNELALLRSAEPVAVLQSLLGSPAPAGLLEMAWKKLLTNHSHDSIGGCCLDRVIRDVLFRGQESHFISEGIVRHGLPAILRRINTSARKADAVLLTAFNLQPVTRSQVLRIEVDIPAEADQGAFRVVDTRGRELEVQLHEARDASLPVEKWGFSYGFRARRYTADIFFEDVPGMGYLTSEVFPCAPATPPPGLLDDHRALENQYLRVEVASNGSLTLLDKATGLTYEGLNHFEDEGEIGNAWIPLRPASDVRLDTLENTATVTVLENGPLRATLEVRNTLQVPVSANADFSARSPETAPLEIVSEISLEKNARRVEVQVRLDNRMRDHRLRVLFPSGVAGVDHYHAAVPFDVVRRPVPKPSDPSWVETVVQTDPNAGFATVSDGARGLTILNRGLYEVEVKDDELRTLALTLLRSSWQHGLWSTERWPDDGFQNPGPHEFSYAILPHSGSWSDAKAHVELIQRDTPFHVSQSGRNPVAGDLPESATLIGLDNDRVLLSGIKLPEQGSGVILRLYNPDAVDLETTVSMFWPIRRARLLDLEENTMEELPVAAGAVRLTVAHHKILTLHIES